MHRLVVTGLNHSTAPLAVREKLSFSPDRRAAALTAFTAQWPGAEAVLLSTCNRTELYVARAVHDHPRSDEMAAFLAAFQGLAPADVARYFYHKEDRSAVEHLFAVAASLDSMVLGETQILGQVRDAYEAASAAGCARAALSPLFQRAIAAAREVMNTTALAEGRVSIASVAVQYAQRIFDTFADKTVLSIGAGKMGTLVLRHFRELTPGTLIICNRDLHKAQALAARFGGRAEALSDLRRCLVLADVVISSTGSDEPIITRELFSGILHQRRYRPIFIIDIALPRDVEPEVGEIENVYLYNIDDLQRVVSQTHSQRASAVEQARSILARHVEDFAVWSRTRQIGPFIESLYRFYHAIAAREADRTLNKLSADEQTNRQQLLDMARRIVNKILHGPVQRLRNADALTPSGAQYLAAMQSLLAPEDPSDQPPRNNAPAADSPQHAEDESRET